jgi:hypothetical protein
VTTLDSALQPFRGVVRFYDPGTGNFLTRDPANAITRSAYGYVYGNPLNATDPSGLYCLTGVKGHREDGSEICNGASEVANNVYHPVRAAVTAPQSAAGLATNLGAGADCRWNSEEWVTVCYGGRTILNAPASTIGGVVNTRLTLEQFARANDGRLLAHEVKHTDQWLIFGWMFPSFDAEAAAFDWVVSKITGCPEGTNNIFEVWAGLKDGGYTR